MNTTHQVSLTKEEWIALFLVVGLILGFIGGFVWLVAVGQLTVKVAGWLFFIGLCVAVVSFAILCLFLRSENTDSNPR